MKIALAGNPNSGKTTLYNALTGRHEEVGNWAGVTVDKKQAPLKEQFANHITLVDLPGAYSIRPFTSEEGITSDFIQKENPDVIINVVDSTNLNRNLFFTTQLLELKIPMVIALNKADILEEKGKIHLKKLENELGCPVVFITATKGKGLKDLIQQAIETSKKDFKGKIFEDIQGIKDLDQQDKARFRRINDVTSRVEKKKRENSDESFQDKLDHWITNPVIGISLFVLIMSAIFNLSINTLGQGIADVLVGVIEKGQVALADFLANAGVHDFLNALLTDGIIGGIGAIVGFIPLIMILMFFLALLEDTGFMARIAMIFDPLFKKIGLSGKSIIPMIVGYGCSIPGIMATRTIKDDRQRRMTALLTPFVPCGAKIPIIALFTTAFFPEHGFVFALTYLVAFGVIIGVGLLLKAITGAKDIENYFIIELPEYRIPSIKRAYRKMIETGKEFVVRAGTIILIANTLVFIMTSFDFGFNLVGEAVNTSILAKIATPLSILLIPIGMGIWQLAAAAITGFIAKEEVVGTLAVVYSMGAAINEEFELTNALLVQETMGITSVAALAFMFFNLFTPPCFAAIGAMKAELNSRRWLIRGITLQFGVGYLIAMVVYQVGTILAYGELGQGFIASIIILFLSIVYLVRLIMKNRRQMSPAYVQ